MAKERTTRLKIKTLDRLKKVGKMGDSYDRVINRLIDFYLEHQKKKNKEKITL